jgi:hypothetical protein
MQPGIHPGNLCTGFSRIMYRWSAVHEAVHMMLPWQYYVYKFGVNLLEDSPNCTATADAMLAGIKHVRARQLGQVSQEKGSRTGQN